MINKGITWLLWALSWAGLGGLHRFYLGRPVSGVLYLCTYNFLGLGLVFDLFHLNDMVDATNLRLQGQLGPGTSSAGQLPPARTKEQFMQDLLRAAQQHGGMLTVTQGVLATGRTFAEVEAQLQDMLKSNFVSIDVHSTTGMVVYRFLELEDCGPPDSPRSSG